MKMAKWIIAVSLLLLANAALADTYLDIYGFAYHPDKSRSCSLDNTVCRETPNERNYGLGVRRTMDYVDAGGGAFKDSFGDWSYYAGIEKQWQLFGPIHAGGQVFVMGRKTFRSYSPFLGALPVVSVRFGAHSLSMSYIPEFEAWKTREVFFFYTSYSIR